MLQTGQNIFSSGIDYGYIPYPDKDMDIAAQIGNDALTKEVLLDEYLDEINEYVSNKEYNKAIDELTTLLDSNPDDAELYYKRGEVPPLIWTKI